MKLHQDPFSVDNQDKMTQTRSSYGQSTSNWKDFFYTFLCPCLRNKKLSQNSSDHRYKLPLERQSRQYTEMMTKNKQGETNWKQEQIIQDQSVIKQESSFKNQDFQPYRKSAIERTNSVLKQFDDLKQSHNIKSGFSIYKYPENKLISVGQFSDRMLCIIKSVKLEPSQIARKKAQQANKIQVKRQLYSNYLDQFWDQRYFLFEKFDEGVKIHQDQWCLIPPQVVCQHLSNSVRCEVLLQAFSGVGNTTVKFGTTCNKVIANTCLTSIDGLVTNIKIYGIQNIEILCEDFLKIKKVFPQVVFLSPKCCQKTPSENEKLLRLYLEKALNLTPNIILLLPSYMDIDKVISICSSSAYKRQTKYSTCSVNIQKIFYQGKLKFIAIYFGALVQKDIKISDQLEFIYDFLTKGMVGTTNYYKKLVKNIRQQYGMMNLLFYIYDSENLYLGKENLENFEQYTLKHNLISKEKIQQMKEQSRKGSFTSVEEQKVEEIENNKSDRTVSDYASYQLSGLQKKLLLERESCEITGQKKQGQSIECIDQDGINMQKIKHQLVGSPSYKIRKSVN